MIRRALAFACLMTTIAHADGPPPDVDLAAVLPRGDEAVEYWDLVGDFDSGHRLYARFLITNVGPGDRTALAFGHWVAPNGTVTPFKNGKREGNWTLGPDRQRLKIGSSVLSLAAGTRHFEVDHDKRGIKMFVDIEADGTALAAPAARPGAVLEVLNLGSAARGSYWLEGMGAPVPLSGRALLSHTVATGDEGASTGRRIDFAVLRGGHRFFLSHAEPRGGGKPYVFAAHAESGRAIVALPGTRVETTPKAGGDAEYPVPGRLLLLGEVSGAIALGEIGLRVDPLDALPRLLKMVYPFRRSPRHAWANGVADLSLKSEGGPAAARIEGAGIATIVHLDSSPR